MNRNTTTFLLSQADRRRAACYRPAPQPGRSSKSQAQANSSPSANALVYSRIFDRIEETNTPYFEIYHSSTVKKVPFTSPPPTPPIKTEITEFSRTARQRCYFHLINTAHLYKSQFVGTYHTALPLNGRSLCNDIHRMNKVIKRLGISQTHIKEFQTQGQPHIHWYLTAEYSEELWKKLGNAWHKIAGKHLTEPELHRWWHVDRVTTKNGKEYRSLIPWDMSPSYAMKYLSKQAQKCIPEGFKGFGHFWGCSRDIKPQATIITEDEMIEKYFIDEDFDMNTGEITEGRKPVEQITRILGRYQDKKHKETIKKAAEKGKKLKFRSIRKQNRSFTVHGGSGIIKQTLNYWSNEDAKKFNYS